MDLATCIALLSETMSDSSEDSDSSEPIKRIPNFIEIIVPSYTEKIFQSHFRISKPVVYSLIERLEASEYSLKYASGRPHVSPEKAFLMTIWYLSNMETFREISDRFNITYSCAHNTLIRVLNFIISLCPTVIRWPNENEKNKIAQEFAKNNINNVIGIIDGCHVKINRPKIQQDSYVNRKGYFSVILQGIVRPNKTFMDVYCGEPGSLHDARVLRRSQIYQKAEDNFLNGYIILGDSAYPRLNWLLPPYRDNGRLTAEERNFNFKHSSTRIVVEHAFGLLKGIDEGCPTKVVLLKGRFRRLLHLFNLDLNVCSKIIMASCVLHNVCIINKDSSVIIVEDVSKDLTCNED